VSGGTVYLPIGHPAITAAEKAGVRIGEEYGGYVAFDGRKWHELGGFPDGGYDPAAAGRLRSPDSSGNPSGVPQAQPGQAQVPPGDPTFTTQQIQQAHGLAASGAIPGLGGPPPQPGQAPGPPPGVAEEPPPPGFHTVAPNAPQPAAAPVPKTSGRDIRGRMIQRREQEQRAAEEANKPREPTKVWPEPANDTEATMEQEWRTQIDFAKKNADLWPELAEAANVFEMGIARHGLDAFKWADDAMTDVPEIWHGVDSFRAYVESGGKTQKKLHNRDGFLEAVKPGNVYGPLKLGDGDDAIYGDFLWNGKKFVMLARYETKKEDKRK